MARHIGWWFVVTQPDWEVLQSTPTITEEQEKEYYTFQGKVFQRAYTEIRNMGLTDVQVEGKDIYLTLAHPGMLIGERGKTIKALNEYLRNTLNDQELGIKLV